MRIVAKRFSLLAIVLVASSTLSVRAQDLEMRRANSAGNWVAYLNNNGSLFNQSDTNHPSILRLGAGGLWTGLDRFDTVIFGTGLWIGGLRHRSGGLVPHSEFAYNPNTAQSEFEPGSVSDGAATDTTPYGRDNYRVYRSDDLVGPPWPLRMILGKAAYIDNPAQRDSAGAKAVVGDEDMFLIYKDSDPDSIADPFGLDVRTTASFWRTGMLANVILVRNEIRYTGKDTIFDPVVALALDGDINNPDDDRTKGVHDEATTASIFFTDGSSSDPLLGVLALGGQYSAFRPATGITSLRYWDINEDPITDSDRYAFLIEEHWDTALTVPGDARILMASLSNTPLLPGDPLDFDYAVFAEPPNGPALTTNDSATMLQVARTISNDYASGAFQPQASVLEANRSGQLEAWPNPATSELSILHSSEKSSEKSELYDALGRRVMVAEAIGGEADFNVRDVAPGAYFVRSGGLVLPVQIEHW